MDGLAKWIDARIEWRVSVAVEPDILFEGRIDTAEAIDDGITRISGSLAGGGRFVLISDESAFTNT